MRQNYEAGKRFKVAATQPRRERNKKRIKELEAQIVEMTIEIKTLRHHLAEFNQRHTVGSALDNWNLGAFGQA